MEMLSVASVRTGGRRESEMRTLKTTFSARWCASDNIERRTKKLLRKKFERVYSALDFALKSKIRSGRAATGASERRPVIVLVLLQRLRSRGNHLRRCCNRNIPFQADSSDSHTAARRGVLTHSTMELNARWPTYAVSAISTFLAVSPSLSASSPLLEYVSAT